MSGEQIAPIMVRTAYLDALPFGAPETTAWICHIHLFELAVPPGMFEVEIGRRSFPRLPLTTDHQIAQYACYRDMLAFNLRAH